MTITVEQVVSNDGCVHRGEKLNDKLHGKYTCTHRDGKTLHMERDYVNGKIHGLSKIYNIHGALVNVAVYRNGLPEGEMNTFFLVGTENETKTVDFVGVDGENLTKEIRDSVDDIKNLTDQDRMMIKVKYGVDCIG